MSKRIPHLIEKLIPRHFWPPLNYSSDQEFTSLSAIFKDIIKRNLLSIFGREKAQLKNIPKADSSIVLAFETINQREALMPIKERLNEETSVLDFFDSRSGISLPVNMYNRLSLRYSLRMILWLFTLNRRNREIYRKNFWMYSKILGRFRYLDLIFKKSKSSIKLVVISNDHIGVGPEALWAGKKNGISTMYIQHASVVPEFPSLTTTYAFLEGEDAKQKYLAAGPTKTEIHIVGSMKMDKPLNSPKLTKPGNSVGLCLNTLFCDLNKNLTLCERLQQKNIPFIIRFHPAMSAEERALFNKPDWKTSIPEEEMATDFIFKCHTLISGDSNIFLEAITLKRRPVYFASTGVIHDLYGFLKMGLLDKAYLEIEDVLLALKENFDLDFHREKARYYNGVLGTAHEGKSTELALRKIVFLTSGKQL